MAMTVLASVALAFAGQSYPAPPPSAGPLPGIVEPSGGTRFPGPVTMHFEGDDGAFRHDLREARREVDRRRRNGEISRHEARQMRREIALIDRVAERYGRDGLSDSERRELAMHAQVLRSQAAVRGTR